jgi:hypothetical protein
MNAHEAIRLDMASESRRRAVRSALVFAALIALLTAFLHQTGLSPNLSIHTMAFGVNGLVLMTACYLASCSPEVRVSEDAASLWMLGGPALPLLAADRFIGTTGSNAAACAAMVIIVGLTTLLLIQLDLGSVRRRFGGAPALRATSAALAATLAIGLHCPRHDALHLMSHVAGAALLCRFCWLALR